MARRKKPEPIEEGVHGLEPDAALPSWWAHEWTGVEAAFVQEYLRTGNAAGAYRVAHRIHGHTDPVGMRTSQVMGFQWLSKPHIRDYIDHCQTLIKQRLALTKENVLEELSKLGFANMTDFVVLQSDGTPQFDFSGLDREQAAAIQEMTIDTYLDGKGEDAREVRSVKVKLAPKLGALEALGKHFKLFTDVIDDTGLKDVADELRERRLARRARREEQKDEGDGSDSKDDDEGRGNGEVDRDA